MKMKEQMGALKKLRPVIDLDSNIIPEVKKWDVGGKYKVELELEQVSKENMDGMIFEDEEFEEMEEKGNVIKGEFIIKKAKAL